MTEYRFAVTIRPDGTFSVDEVPTNDRDFLRKVCELIGDGCDMVQAVPLQPKIYLLVDEEVFLRETQVPNVPLSNFVADMGAGFAAFTNAGVVIGQDTGLTSAQVNEVRAVLERIKR